MNNKALFAALSIAGLNTLTFLPPLRTHAGYLVAASAVLALWSALVALGGSKSAPTGASTPAPPAPVEPLSPPPVPVVQHLEEAEAVGLLAVFQSKGRLVDFLMDDIAAYGDAQVGAAARVVHQGCSAALREHFTVVPVSTEREGARIVVPTGAPAGEYELVGKVTGQAPFSGVLVHKGWKATSVKLPRSLLTGGGGLPPIAPAQVELR